MTAEAPRRDTSMLSVAVGLGVFGLANFAFLGLAGRDLSPAGSAPVAVAWTILNAVGIGLFQPLEQETSRRLSAARSQGLTGSNLRSMVRYTSLAASLVLAAGLLGLPWLGDLLFSGADELVLVTVFGLLSQAVAYFARGLLSGQGRFTSYGAQLAVDGALRIAGAAALFLTGAGSRLSYGLVLVVVPVLATLLTVPVGRLVATWRDRDGAPSPTPMAPLVASSSSSQILANFGPLAMAALATTAQQDLSGRFVAAVTIARIPLFVFAAVQAVFLPALAAHAAQDAAESFGRAVRRALLLTVALGLAGVAGVALLGHLLMELVYGPEFAVPTSVLVLIAVSAALFMLAQVFAQALLALDLERLSTIAWTVGVVVSVLTLLLPWELATRVSTALCTGAGAALVLLVIALLTSTRRWHARLGSVPAASSLAAASAATPDVPDVPTLDHAPRPVSAVPDDPEAQP